MSFASQGNAGVGRAIAFFTSRGWRVSIPLTDTQDYDLVVDDGSGLSRVQVKTTKSKDKSGSYRARLCVDGGNRSNGNSKKFFDNQAVEYLFVLDETGTMYLIPASEIEAKCTINLNAWKDWIVEESLLKME